MSILLDSITAAGAGHLLPSSAENIGKLLAQATSPVAEAAVRELAEAGHWDELNNRFFRTLAFGTGGLRGKTIGDVLTKAEEGVARPDGRPEFACIGTNAVNNYNIVRATRGLVTYVCDWHRNQKRPGLPSICICYDTRFFSREFADLAARVIIEHGCDALLFESPRSTPELSFAVRHAKATAGINITASHNPPAYNGYKVYFEDGAQVIEPHASAIIKLVDSMEGESYTPVPEAQRGHLVILGRPMDEDYMERLETLVINPALLQRTPPMKVVYTPLHGVGGVIVVPMLHRLGVKCLTVSSQMIPDGHFPTVKSPNPENPEALHLAMELADQEEVPLVMATDPDDDRMGVAARNAAGALQILTGNQIGSLLVWYRLMQFFAMGILNEKNKAHAVMIKTFVTTDLQKAIAESFGVRCVETLTGFKYIGAKLQRYEEELPPEVRVGYRDRSEAETRLARLRDSSYFVFGGEESYGYSTGDFVRDKDGNAAVVCFSEVAAYGAAKGLTIPALLDRIYAEYGFYLESGESLTFDGAEGAAKITRLVDSYAAQPPVTVNGAKVLSVRNFATEEIYDVEGERIPAEPMLIISLEKHHRIAIRPSGTEPKIKYYLFAAEKPVSGVFSEEELAATKVRVAAGLERLWQWLKADAEKRIG